MGHQLTAIVALFFISMVACDTCKYVKFTPDHTGCKSRNPSCNIVDNQVTNDDKNMIVKLHNQYREKVAMGRETALGGLPTASNMMEMVWDDELSSIAQRHAELCEFEHDCNDCRKVDRFFVGQCLYMRPFSPFPSSRELWENVVELFYIEVDKIRKEYLSSYKFHVDYGHFSQIVWADTWRVGCGKVVFEEGSEMKTIVSCDYGPAGNWENQPIYKFGSPCSDCPSDTCCGDSCKESGVSTNFQGLCSGQGTARCTWPRET